MEEQERSDRDQNRRKVIEIGEQRTMDELGSPSTRYIILLSPHLKSFNFRSVQWLSLIDHGKSSIFFLSTIKSRIYSLLRCFWQTVQTPSPIGSLLISIWILNWLYIFSIILLDRKLWVTNYSRSSNVKYYVISIFEFLAKAERWHAQDIRIFFHNILRGLVMEWLDDDQALTLKDLSPLSLTIIFGIYPSLKQLVTYFPFQLLLLHYKPLIFPSNSFYLTKAT